MRLATVLTPVTDENLQLAAQCGVTDLVLRYPYGDPHGPRDAAARSAGDLCEVLRLSKARAASFGLNATVVEGYLPIENLKLGIDDGTQMRAMQDLIRAMGETGIELLCYNFMAGTDWARTKLDAQERGGEKGTAFDFRDFEKYRFVGAQMSGQVQEQNGRSQDP